ncbi:AHG_G0047570.mRNA.1.CDS.1 [Saccharomyces cerevisiae]|nr:AHG_G0047570.mRNA.1.CDS.1 [Saccharomyces cerevisiae]CAI6870015.1 AHG_G0047570.mRNA.1.CDS.1 [Saccharomyces cerevisiae]
MSKTDVKKSREASGILTLQVNLRERRNFLNLMQNKLFSWKIRFSAIKGKCSQKSKYFRRSRSEDLRGSGFEDPFQNKKEPKAARNCS